MKKLFYTLLLFSFANCYTAYSQESINLMDLISEQPTDSLSPSPIQESVTVVKHKHQTPGYEWEKHRHSLIFSWGAPSVVEKSIEGLAWLLSLGQTEKMRFIGPFSIEYDYNCKRWLRVGGRFSYLCSYYPGNLPYSHGFITSARMDFTYLNRKKIKLYSGLETGLGIGYHSFLGQGEDFVKPYWAINVCAFGLQAGGDHVFFMTELNLGNIDSFRIGIGTHL